MRGRVQLSGWLVSFHRCNPSAVGESRAPAAQTRAILALMNSAGMGPCLALLAAARRARARWLRARLEVVQVLSFLLGCACCAAVSIAGAQNSPQVVADGGDEYHRVIEEALQEFNLGNWDEAAVLFERAHGINPSARTERGMGMAAFEARHYAAAITHFDAALRERRNPLTAAQRADMQRALERAQDYVVRLVLDVTPSDARVRINNHAVEPDPQGERLVDPGLLEIAIAADGYESTLRRVHALPGKRETIVVKLRPTPSAAAERSTQAARNESSGNVWKWALGTGGLVSLAVGGAFLIVQRAEAERFNAMCDRAMLTDTCVSIERSAGGFWYAGSIVGIGVGAGLLASSAVMFLLEGSASKPEHAQQRSCQLGFADLGVACQLRF